MLAEWLTYLATPCPRHLREMGYLRELIALRARYRRCRRGWTKHLDQCRGLIAEAARASTRRRKAVVLGSGFLHDIPLADLGCLFGEVVLVDLMHLRAARRKARGLANVRFLDHDLTGVVKAVHAHAHVNGGGPLPLPAPGGLPEDDADLVISANILSQLPLLPAQYLERQSRRHSGQEIADFSRALIQHHLAALADVSGTVCLITEVDRQIRDGGKTLRSEDPLHGVPIPLKGKEWVWDIAPRPEMDGDYDLRYRVIGGYWNFRNSTRAAP